MELYRESRYHCRNDLWVSPTRLARSDGEKWVRSPAKKNEQKGGGRPMQGEEEDYEG
ncbi:hypothetical protein Csa_017429 [Cucumis sativus]|uniref:Uncharacterized protein n=1 Tax=Cucumis sativus TaxID=3659 RepID=A0A0A0LDG1_CUCSA|nr:hypothetical protein Csa_017429 [Cucumis sativus]